MELVLSVPAFAIFAIAVMAGFVWLRRTRVWWLVPLAIVGYGVAIFLALPWYEDRAITNVMHAGTSAVVVIAGVVAFAVLARKR